ncbi:penicillin-binding transpeptidase domain-containing protein [Saccharomonospora sp. NPDC046836]|uniref:penicillin-binding transpeptidase domain-containing protein n=1 Tax=Saccharomonospora sp. NPDC046836 TaxID=3156921 RepID=UPI0033F4092F
MQARTRRLVLGGAVLAVIAIVTAGVVVLLNESSSGTAQQSATGPGAGEVALDYLDAFAVRDVAAAAALTDDPAAAEAALHEATAQLGVTAVKTRAEPPAAEDGPDRATRDFTVTWTLGEGRTWTYDNTVTVLRTDAGWRVHWSPALIHPRLETGQALALRSMDGVPAVVARDGEPLLRWHTEGIAPAEGAGAPLLLPGMGRVATEHAGGAWQIVLVDAAGAELATLHGDPAATEPLASTVSVTAQQAAQAAVDAVSAPALLVAIEPSSGDLLAVAQNPLAGSAPNALTGLYAPGSTFKIATATAALEQGAAEAGTVLPCPGTARIGTRTIPNDGQFDLGSVPLHTAFARSCNTTFAELAAGLPDDALARSATELGLNADFTIPGITTEAGSVEAAPDPVQRLEDGIGQGRVQASPFGVALMAATVAHGAPVIPRLWRDLDTTVNTGYDVPSAPVLGAVRDMMREVVTGGTATALSGLGDVRGKTGTAELPDGTQAHGWFAGYRGDVAFAVLVEGAGSSAPAVQATAAFLGGLPG